MVLFIMSLFMPMASGFLFGNLQSSCSCPSVPLCPPQPTCQHGILFQILFIKNLVICSHISVNFLLKIAKSYNHIFINFFQHKPIFKKHFANGKGIYVAEFSCKFPQEVRNNSHLEQPKVISIAADSLLLFLVDRFCPPPSECTSAANRIIAPPLPLPPSPSAPSLQLFLPKTPGYASEPFNPFQQQYTTSEVSKPVLFN